MGQVFTGLVRTEGCLALYEGFGPVIARAFPANAACFQNPGLQPHHARAAQTVLAQVASAPRRVLEIFTDDVTVTFNLAEPRPKAGCVTR